MDRIIKPQANSLSAEIINQKCYSQMIGISFDEIDLYKELIIKSGLNVDIYQYKDSPHLAVIAISGDWALARELTKALFELPSNGGFWSGTTLSNELQMIPVEYNTRTDQDTSEEVVNVNNEISQAIQSNLDEN